VKWIHPTIFAFGCLVLPGCIPWHMRVTPSVSGVVIDAFSGNPVAGASVHIEEFPEKTTITKQDGQFFIAAIREWEVLSPSEFSGDRRPAYRLIATAKDFEDGSRIWYIGDDRPQMIELKRSTH